MASASFHLSSSSRSSNGSGLRRSRRNTISLNSLWAILRDVSDFAAPVARLSAFVVDSAAIGGSAVAGDMAEFAARVAFHGLGLAVAGEVVRSTALVACRGAVAVASAHAAAATGESATGGSVCAVASQVPDLAAGVAAGIATSA